MEPGKTKRGKYLSGQSTRTNILEAAVKIIGSSGYHGLALRALATESKVAHATVVYHFVDKETLLTEVILYWEAALGLVNCSTNECNQSVELESITFDSYEDLLLRLMRLAKRPNISDILSLSCTLINEGSDPKHPARDYLKHRHEALLTRLVSVLHKSRSSDELHYSNHGDRCRNLSHSMVRNCACFKIPKRPLRSYQFNEQFLGSLHLPNRLPSRKTTTVL